MIEIMRQLILAMTALISLLQGQVRLGAVTETQIINQIKSSEDSYYATYGKYEQVSKTKQSGYEKEVHEYLGPKGAGYVIFLRKTENNKIYEKAENFGNEVWRSYDWKLIQDLNNVASTTTP